MRNITKAHVEAKIENINYALGFRSAFGVPGTIELEASYNGQGGYSVNRVVDEAHHIERLTFGFRSLSDCALFLDGMIAHHRLQIDG